MRIFKMLVALALLSGSLQANAEKATVVVTGTDGNTTQIELCDGMSGSYNYVENVLHLRITTGQFIYQDGQLVPDTTSENPGVLYLSMPVTRIDNLVFLDVAEIKGIENNNGLSIDLHNSVLKFKGVTKPLELTISSIDGKIEATCSLKADTEIDMVKYGSGLHIVKAGERTFKILVK